MVLKDPTHLLMFKLWTNKKPKKTQNGPVQRENIGRKWGPQNDVILIWEESGPQNAAVLGFWGESGPQNGIVLGILGGNS